MYVFCYLHIVLNVYGTNTDNQLCTKSEWPAIYMNRLRLVSPSIRRPSLKIADQIDGLRTKHVKKRAACRRIPQQLSMRTCVKSAQQQFWLARFNVQHETWSWRTVSRCVNPCLSVLVFEHPRRGHAESSEDCEWNPSRLWIACRLFVWDLEIHYNLFWVQLLKLLQVS